MTQKNPFSRYFRRCNAVKDISEYLRSLAADDSIQIGNEILNIVTNQEVNNKYLLLFQEVREKIKEFATTSNELSLEVRYCCSGSFVKRHEQMYKIYHLRDKEPDNEPRSSNILGALRWALEKYIILKLALVYSTKLNDLSNIMEWWQNYRRSQRGGSKVFTMFFPPNLVFGRGGRASSIRVREVGGSRDSGLCTVRLSLSIEPPPAVYMAFRRLGVPARDVERVIASFLAVAVALLNPSYVYGGEAPVPLTRDLHESTTQRAVIETPYEVDIDLVDYVIENFWCKVVNNA